MAYHFATPSDRDALRGLSDIDVMKRMLMNVVRLITTNQEAVDRLVAHVEHAEKTTVKHDKAKLKLNESREEFEGARRRNKMKNDVAIHEAPLDVTPIGEGIPIVIEAQGEIM
ncbi:hypothetical protein L1987_43566 [Smallanthus sonchifolius]|uniref:Uncharacterized protein n=1 Tax=Smallanthus sonchifolius TaxID=185202 RepID=A0ACB9GP16_9ASTR|nr:hypothetical protein L1987_43566 [Smallanthus sonchifolius]